MPHTGATATLPLSLQVRRSFHARLLRARVRASASPAYDGRDLDTGLEERVDRRRRRRRRA